MFLELRLSLDNVDEFCANFKTKINATLAKLDRLQSDALNSDNTIVYPFLQMGPFSIQQEEKFVDKLLKHQVSYKIAIMIS